MSDVCVGLGTLTLSCWLSFLLCLHAGAGVSCVCVYGVVVVHSEKARCVLSVLLAMARGVYACVFAHLLVACVACSPPVHVLSEKRKNAFLGYNAAYTASTYTYIVRYVCYAAWDLVRTSATRSLVFGGWGLGCGGWNK